jgi:hypothetical protein
MSPDPPGIALTFPTVGMLTVAAITQATAPADRNDKSNVKTTKSSCPVVGFDPPHTEGFVDAGFDSIYKTVGFTGALILMFGTDVWWLCKKQATIAYSISESELYAATEISKFIKWLRVLMADVGLPYRTAIVRLRDKSVTLEKSLVTCVMLLFKRLHYKMIWHL